MAAHGISPIDLVVVNLYAFEATVAKGGDFATCIENIDIGGPSMLRSAAKNNAAVAVASSPAQYEALLAELAANGGACSRALRRSLAAAAFALTAAYDATIAAWFAAQEGVGPVGGGAEGQQLATVTRAYVPDLALKYGCNPHQAPAWVGHIAGAPPPFRVLNGKPGYINFLDAANAWQLVSELRSATGLPAAASFKHCSPAGAAVAVPLTAEDRAVYEVAEDAQLTPLAVAYLRARQADPMCSYGDFAAVSEARFCFCFCFANLAVASEPALTPVTHTRAHTHSHTYTYQVVDEATALILKSEVSDGLIAPGYSPAAAAILSAKKGGAFILLEATAGYAPPPQELREVYGMVMAQRRNDASITAAGSLNKIVTGGGTGALPNDAARDLAVALVAIKYTQSNSVGYALGGQMIGVGAGQQSRVDCVKLAGRKVATWWLRRHPKVAGLPFKAEVKRTARVNARVRYIEGDMAPTEHAAWSEMFTSVPPPLTEEEKGAWMEGLRGVALASDAFFPFRDSIDHAAKFGVSWVAQPGGSVQDEEVTKAADSYGMLMCHGLPRLFHH